MICIDVGGLVAASLHGGAGVTELDRDGLWLIGLGALVVVITLLIQGPQRGVGGMLVRDIRKPISRVSFGLGLSGAVLVAAGSILLLVSALPRKLVVVLSLAFVPAVIYLVGALQVRRDTRMLRLAAQNDYDANPTDKKKEQELKYAKAVTSWRWWLWHPYSSWQAAHRWARRRSSKSLLRVGRE